MFQWQKYFVFTHTSRNLVKIALSQFASQDFHLVSLDFREAVSERMTVHYSELSNVDLVLH